MPFEFALIIGVIIGAILMLIVREWGWWPVKNKRDKVLCFFSTYQRLRRKAERLQRRIYIMGQMQDRKVEIKNARDRVAELEQRLSDEAFKKPEEFLDTE